MSFAKNNKNIAVKIGEYEIENSECEKLLGVKLDWKLNFDDHISHICKKARGKLNALARIAPLIGLSKRRIPMITLFNSQFSYCPLNNSYLIGFCMAYRNVESARLNGYIGKIWIPKFK